MVPSRLHHRAGSLADERHVVRKDFAHTGLTVIRLESGQPVELETGATELAVLPLSAQRVELSAGGERIRLDGRATVFARVSDFAYVGAHTALELTSETGGEVALPSAPCEEELLPRYGPAEDVAVEVRGGGQATRQITNFMSPEAWSHASKLMCVEVYTPDGNWSSYPPHRHDDSPECPVNNEEIYYFRIGDAGTVDYSEVGFGMHRTYTPDGEIDENVAVHDGDVFHIPRGYHGPCTAAPGYDMYYLNVLAGPSGERSMAFCDDPDHHWIRETWTDDDVDPRCPMTTATGKR